MKTVQNRICYAIPRIVKARTVNFSTKQGKFRPAEKAEGRERYTMAASQAMMLEMFYLSEIEL